MNFDRTYCSGARCGKANTCARWIEFLRWECKDKKIDLTDRRISVAQFADHAGACSHYEPINRDGGELGNASLKETP